MPQRLQEESHQAHVRPKVTLISSISDYQKKLKKYQLTREHIQYLTSQETLELWAGKSLAERAKLFHRKFTDRWTYPAKISKIYKDNGITKKRVKIQKSTGKQTLTEYQRATQKCKEEVEQAIAEGLPVIYIDESVFSKRTINDTDYSQEYCNISVQEKDLYCPYISAVAAVSYDKGLELLVTHQGSINSELFVDFVQ